MNTRAEIDWRSSFVGTLALLLLASTASAAVLEQVSFNEHIRPILSDRCFYCHGPDEKHREADLRLDTFAGATVDLGDHAAIVAGQPAQSELLKRVTETDPDSMMPPPKAKKPRLTADEIALLTRWIEQGAEYEGHWAFLPLRSDPLPALKDAAWPHSPVDSFVLARLEQEGLRPSPAADRRTLIRRAALDLLGLLPSPDEVEQFVGDLRPDAYEALVERLLASPHYGERWGRHWLDQARYADSSGYAIDADRQMWPYRDWVIRALNDDLPFDQFTIEQLAGDLLPSPTKSQLIATAYHRNTLINQEGGTDREQFRVEAVLDRVNTTGAVWLGLTVGCAQCHTHKFDPITQREYYELTAFFNSAADANDAGPTISVARGEVFGNPVALPPPEPSPAPSQPTDRKAKSPVKQTNRNVAQLMIMRDLPQPRDTFLLTRGDFTRPDKARGPLAAGVIHAVPPEFAGGQPGQRPTRLDLARWLVHPGNPLMPRVTMNRTWMRYFGRGLVETDEDFGSQGAPPTHPALLDWLAREFLAGPPHQNAAWGVKRMHRLIATSATYRQASKPRPDLVEKDPRNLLLARQGRVRFEAEIARDAALTASGLLARTLGGPSVHPPQPEGVYAFTQVNKNWTTAAGADRYRRALYTFFYRSAPYPLFTTFDAPDFQAVCTRRLRSNTPLQSLTLANDAAFVEMAQALALRLAREVPGEAREQLDSRIRRAFLLCVSREPSPQELAILRGYFLGELAAYAQNEAAAEKLAGTELANALPKPEGAALVSLARAVLNTDNFIMRE